MYPNRSGRPTIPQFFVPHSLLNHCNFSHFSPSLLSLSSRFIRLSNISVPLFFHCSQLVSSHRDLHPISLLIHLRQRVSHPNRSCTPTVPQSFALHSSLNLRNSSHFSPFLRSLSSRSIFLSMLSVPLFLHCSQLVSSYREHHPISLLGHL